MGAVFLPNEESPTNPRFEKHDSVDVTNESIQQSADDNNFNG